MNIINEIREACRLVVFDPEEVVIENEFGNLIIKDANDQFLRLCSEDAYCEVIAETIEQSFLATIN